MKIYDLYLFVPDTEVIGGWHKFDAASDEAAIEVAQGLAHEAPLELWRESTLVRRWEEPRRSECPPVTPTVTAKRRLQL